MLLCKAVVGLHLLSYIIYSWDLYIDIWNCVHWFSFFSPQNGGGGLGLQSGGRTWHFSGWAEEVDWRDCGAEWDSAEEKGSADRAEGMGGAERGGGGNDRDAAKWCQPVSKCNTHPIL